MQAREVREFLEKLCNGTKEIPKRNHSLFFALQKLGCVSKKSEYFKLKEGYVVGSLDVVRKDLVFLKSFCAKDSQDFRINRPFLGLCSGDIVLAKTFRTRANIVSLLFSPEVFVLVYLEKIKGKVCAIDLLSSASKPIVYALKARQKALNVLPLHTVLKISVRNGEIVEVLGVLEDERIDEKIVLSSLQREEEFSLQAYELADSFGLRVYPELYPHRKDLTHLPFCTIDPVDAKDHDDAIYFDKDSQTLYVAIADVSEYVNKDDILDKEAKKRGFTLYLPHTSYPMLPPNLSQNMCSLKENEVRLALVWEIKLSSKGEVLQEQLYEGMIINHCNLSYEKVDALLEGKLEIQPSISGSILGFYPYAKMLFANRLKKGYTFHNPEIKLQLNPECLLIGIKESTEGESHHIVEEAMLLANICSAKVLSGLEQEEGVYGVYRIHEEMRGEKLEELMWDLHTMGYRGKYQDIHQLIGDIQNWAKKQDMVEQVDKMIIQAQNQAQYCSKNIGHFGLGFEKYTHFTSPIRRYSDICIHRILKEWIKTGHKPSKKMLYLSQDYPTLCKTLNEQERNIVRAEIVYKDRKFAHWANRHLGEILEVSVIDERVPPLCVAREKITGARIVLKDEDEVCKFDTFRVVLEEVNLANARIYARKSG